MADIENQMPSSPPADGGPFVWFQPPTGDTSPSSLESPLLKSATIQIRKDFVKKVYGIFAVQLLVTVAVAMPFVLSKAVQSAVAANHWVVFVLCLASIAVSVCYAGDPSLMRVFPWNYLALSGLTVIEGTLVGLICSAYSIDSVLIAVAMTCAIVAALTALAVFTETDFTGYVPYLFTAGVSLVVFGIILLLLPTVPILHVLYSYVGAFIFSCYIILDTQMILGGKHRRYQFGVDDYAFAALAIYLDVVNLFIQLLKILGEKKK
ncbi:unnamed protein product [Vitrella brassicaformis CCMP3155]|uniref:Uncharacterized protein n=1 Tax=Vitrella brassicaformis (strain CCMP3155) TaxID=1169540 RepID=A0A0G4GMR9_VITBC|nr:unnamed protein product [Vitrella brassicaformis CCMP3155]|eukprot:CEM31494.1 unnamed protein product [Vitrella brassicaformis CCMP3155]